MDAQGRGQKGGGGWADACDETEGRIDVMVWWWSLGLVEDGIPRE
jgi:hypothetical protein